jgi:hypothetical protein
MELVPNEGDIWTLSAESTDDLLAWQTSFDDVRQLYIERMQRQQAQSTNARIPSNRYDFSYQQDVYNGGYPHQVYRASDGSTHTIIIVDRDSGYYRGGDNIAAGALSGMAVGSLMLWPMFMFPLMWC